MQTLGALLEQEGYHITMASSKSNMLLRLLAMVWTTFKQRNTADVVLIDTYSTLNFYYAYVISQLCRFWKLNYIPILHGGNLPSRLTRNPLLSRAIFKFAYCNVAPSTYLKIAFEASGYTNVIHIPNVIDIRQYPFQTRAHEQPHLLWVRSFAKLYHPEMAVRVLKGLQDKGLKATLCMVGPDRDGTLSTVEQLATDLSVHVTFTGKLSKSEWIRLSKDYNVFINTTNFDNTPISVIEAMALGLPVVSTNVGGLPYLIDHGTDGLLVPANEVSAMVMAIERLFEDAPLRLAIINKARLKAEHFDWATVKQLWKDVL